MRDLRILVVDDSPVFLSAVVGLLEDISGIEIVGCAASGHEAIELTARTLPDVVLTDLAMPGMDGLELTQRLNRTLNPPKVVMMTAHTQPQYRHAATAMGVVGFVLKPNLTDDLPKIVQDIKDNNTLVM